MTGRVDEGQLRLMTQMLYHRGPDDGAMWISPSGAAGLGHRRLSVIDTSTAAAQPMLSEDGRYALVFNGELFNFIELRSILEKRGIRFRSESDSEVLLHACITWGEGVLQKLAGQFSFAFWDEEHRSLFAARDHLGIKPFVYAEAGGRLLFASEAKALLAVEEGVREADWSLLPQYLAFLWIPGERSMFRGVRRLLPGHWLRWTDGRLETGQWWDPAARWLHATKHGGSYAQRRDDFLQLLDHAVRSQLVSDVPLGLLLSGGLDSTAVLSSMAGSSAVPRAFTASYGSESREADVFEDDLAYARIAARHFHAELQEEQLEADLPTLLPEAVYHCDDPLADPTIVTNLALTRAAKPSLTVLLSGMGADELLAGYPRYRASILGMRGVFSLHAPWRMLGATIAALQGGPFLGARRVRRLRTLADGLQHPFPASFLRFSTYFDVARQRKLLLPALAELPGEEDLYAVHGSMLEATAALTPLQSMLATDLVTFLPHLNLENMDKTSMASGVEIRVPFLDHRLVEFSMTLPDSDKLQGGRSKVILRDAMRGLLPESILKRPKTGYSPPVRGWVGRTQREYVQDLLGSSPARQRGLFDQQEVQSLVDANTRGEQDNSMQIWQLLVLEVWQRSFLDAPPPAPAADPSSLRVIAPPAADE